MLVVSQGLVAQQPPPHTPYHPPPWLLWSEPGKCVDDQPVFSEPHTTFIMVDIIPILQTVKLNSLPHLSVLVRVLQRNRTNRVRINVLYRKVFIVRHGLTRLWRLTSPQVCRESKQTGDPGELTVLILA